MSEKRLIDANALLSHQVEANRMGGAMLVVGKGHILAAPTIDADPITGETSDGYHTFNELYHHRAILFSVICNSCPEMAWKSRLHHDGTMYDGMFIVGIQTQDGQATYHYDIDPYWDMFKVRELPQAPEWDGHTPDDAIARIATIDVVRHGAWKQEDTLKDYYFCSRCLAGAFRKPVFKHCPHCGAKMDGAAHD